MNERHDEVKVLPLPAAGGSRPRLAKAGAARFSVPRRSPSPRHRASLAETGREEIGQLVRAAGRSETAAWDRLSELFGGLLANVARSYGLSEADVLDVSQDVWVRLYLNIDRLRDPDSVGGWLATTMRNEALQLLRRRDRSTPVGDSRILDGVDDYTDPDLPLTTAERNVVLSELIESLPEPYLSLARELMADPTPSYREISLKLGIPMGSIGPARRRCFDLLRRKCVRAGIGPGEFAGGTHGGRDLAVRRTAS